MEIPIKLQVFEGPMDLLMHLLEKNKIDIFDIPIVTITDQYLEYVNQMEQTDMNVTSSFLVMACTLLDIKSRMLLPRNEEEEGEEEDPREELVRRLLEYKMYKSASEELRVRSIEAGQQYFREQDLPDEVRHYIPPIAYEQLIGDTTMDRLRDIFSDVLRRKKSRVDPVRSGFREIPKEEVNTRNKELYIRAFLAKHPRTDFRSLLEAESSKEEVIVTFLILLELIRMQVIRITQEENGGPILIETVEEEVPPAVMAAAPSTVVAETKALMLFEPEPSETETEPDQEQDCPFSDSNSIPSGSDDPLSDSDILVQSSRPTRSSLPARRKRTAAKHAAYAAGSAGRRQEKRDKRLRKGFWKRRRHHIMTERH